MASSLIFELTVNSPYFYECFVNNSIFFLQELEPTVGEALVKMWDRFSNFLKNKSPHWENKVPKQSKDMSDRPPKTNPDSPSQQSHDNQNNTQQLHNLHLTPQDHSGYQGRGSSKQHHQDQGYYSQSPGQYPHGQGRNNQGAYGRRSGSGHHSHGGGSPAQMVNHGMFTHQGMNYQQMGTGYNMGPMGAFSGVVMPSGPSVSPHRGISPIMILQRNNQGQQHQSYRSSHHQGSK